MSSRKSYSEVIKLPTFEDRFEYLKMNDEVGIATFGFQRPLNQKLYGSRKWHEIRRKVILRDNARDLAVPGREIYKYALIHHINPITEKDILNADPSIFDFDNLICVTKRTHNAIHFADESQIITDFVPRKPGDTWF